MLMTVVVQDSISQLSPKSQQLHIEGALSILLYADDSLLIGASEAGLQELLDAVAQMGGRFGMELHWKKFQLLEVNTKFTILTPSGEQIPPADLLTYLGANLYKDGCIHSELSKKLRSAWSDFCKLHKLWGHSSLSMLKKILIFQAVTISRLLYGLSSAWLNVAEIRRLNGFQARCLRKIAGIKPSFISRVSNKTVLQKTSQKQLGDQLLKQQMLLYGKVSRSHTGDLLRDLTFIPGTLQPATGQYVRRVGRPRNEWAVMLQREAFKMSSHANTIVHDRRLWQQAIERYFE